MRLPFENWNKIDQKNRQEFQRRLRFAEKSSVINGGKWTAILVHPPSDDPEMAGVPGWHPGSCVLVDSYVCFNETVVFVEVSARSITHHLPGLLYWYDDNIKIDKIWAVIDKETVDTNSIRIHLDRIGDYLGRNDIRYLRAKHRSPFRLGIE